MPRILAVVTLALLLGCNGIIADPGGSGSGSGGGTGASPTAPSPVDLAATCDDPGAPVESPLRRLSRVELENTLEDLLGDAVFDGVRVTFGAFPGDDVGPGNVDSFQQLHTGAHVQAMIETGDRAAGLLAEQPAVLDALGVGCVVDAAPSEECVRDFVTRFGRRVYRRPLSAAEIDDHVAFHAAAPDPTEGFHMVIMRLLSSPQLLFHVEVEGDVDDDGALHLDDYAVANRLSYMILGSMPTDALFAAAEAGELRTVPEIEAQVRALLEEPRAREHVARFFNHWLEVDDIPGIPDEPGVLEGMDRGGLRDAMLAELEHYLGALFWEDGADYRTLMTSTATFAEDERVASIYGVSTWSPGASPPRTGPERGGLPLRAALLLTETHPTAPIHRGVFLRRQILCDSLPAPNADIVASRLDGVGEIDPAEMSSKEQIELITGEEPCATCHARINPLSFGLEGFDRLGRFRDVERVYRDGTLVAEHPIDTTVAPDIEEGGPETVASGAELVDAIAESDKGHACFAQRLFEHTRLRMPTEADACQVQRVYRALRDERVSLLDAFVMSVAQEVVLTRALEGSR